MTLLLLVMLSCQPLLPLLLLPLRGLLWWQS
jgi:hypothetical protein